MKIRYSRRTATASAVTNPDLFSPGDFQMRTALVKAIVVPDASFSCPNCVRSLKLDSIPPLCLSSERSGDVSDSSTQQTRCADTRHRARGRGIVRAIALQNHADWAISRKSTGGMLSAGWILGSHDQDANAMLFGNRDL